MSQFIQDTELLDALKKLGFDKEVLYVRPRTDPFGMPMITTQYGHTIEQVERWLWEKHGIAMTVGRYILNAEHHFSLDVHSPTGLIHDSIFNDDSYPDPFSARLEGIRQAVKYLEQKGAHNEQG